MDISVIIPTINEQLTVSSSIESAWEAGADEVVVSDGGSQDQTVLLADSLGCCVVESAPGRGTQLDAGVRAASGQVYLFLHADNRMHPDMISQLRRAMQDARVVFGAFRQRIEARPAIYRAVEFGNSFRARFLRLPYGDQGIFVRRDALQQVGGVPHVPLFEDVILSQRLRKLASPRLLPGPIFIGARRWEQNGVLRQTVRNWTLMLAFRLGASPERLARYYLRHTAAVESADEIAVPSK